MPSVMQTTWSGTFPGSKEGPVPSSPSVMQPCAVTRASTTGARAFSVSQTGSLNQVQQPSLMLTRRAEAWSEREKNTWVSPGPASKKSRQAPSVGARAVQAPKQSALYVLLRRQHGN